MRLSAFVLFIFLLTGCSSPAERLWEDYQSRLDRVLRINTDITPPGEIARPDRLIQRELFQAIPSFELSVIEAWEIKHCELFKLIGERNSVLGKLSSPELRWNYERRLLITLPSCIADERTPDKTKARLSQLQSDRTQQYAAVVWNATFGNEDFRTLFTLQEEILPVNKTLEVADYSAALQQLSYWQDITNPKPDQAVLSLNGLAHRFPVASASLQSERLALWHLLWANAKLEWAASNQRLCPQGIELPELERAQNVLVTVFIGRIQPWLVALADARRETIDPTIELFSTFQTEAAISNFAKGAVQEHFDWGDELNQRYLKALTAHTQAWNNLMASCQRSITPRTGQ